MQKNVRQIRDLEIIEKELHSSAVGILALYEDEKIIQLATTYLYLDKNIYIFLDDEELYQGVNFDSQASFALIKNDKIRKNPKSDVTTSYQSLSITISGNIRKVEEQKLDEITTHYINKYSKNIKDDEDKPTISGKAVIIDSEEIQAIEETGG